MALYASGSFCTDQLNGFFSGEMLNVETQDQQSVEPVLQFLLQGFVMMGIISVAEHSCHPQFFGLVINNVYLAKCYHTAVESGVFLGNHIVLVDDAKRCPGAALYGFDFMTGQRTVKVQPAVVVHVAQGDGVRMKWAPKVGHKTFGAHYV